MSACGGSSEDPTGEGTLATIASNSSGTPVPSFAEISNGSRPGGPNKSLWWRWRAPHNSRSFVQLGYGILPDVTLAVYTGSSVETLTLVGNTGTYMQYSYARNRAIFRKGGEDVAPFLEKRRQTLNIQAEPIRPFRADRDKLFDIIENLLTAYPHHAIWAEESGKVFTLDFDEGEDNVAAAAEDDYSQTLLSEDFAAKDEAPANVFENERLHLFHLIVSLIVWIMHTRA